MIYLDNAATTRVHPDVAKAMIDVLNNLYGNPNSLYYEQAVKSKNAIEIARSEIASLVNTLPSDVFFTSGATEGNNMVIKGVIEKSDKKHIVTSSVEHSSILETCKYLEKKGYKVTYLGVDNKGRINLNELELALTTETALVSIMWANNETGSLNDISKISEICSAKKIPFHTDATQAIGKVIVDLMKMSKIDYLTMSAHKFYGPKGIGVCIIKNFNPQNPTLSPLIHGGDQEFGLRGGTLPTHQIVGMGVAARKCKENLLVNIEKLKGLESQLLDRLHLVYDPNIEILNSFKEKTPGLVSVRFKGINNQILLKSIAENICASSGSACSNSKPSHVLEAMGYGNEIIKEVIRISLSPYDDYDNFVDFE